MLAKDAEQRDILQKLEMVEKALPEIKRLVRNGNIAPVPQRDVSIIDGLVKGVFSVSVKDIDVDFRLCRYDLLDIKPPSRIRQFFTDLIKTLHA